MIRMDKSTGQKRGELISKYETLSSRPCVDIVEEPEEDEQWYCPKCRPTKSKGRNRLNEEERKRNLETYYKIIS